MDKKFEKLIKEIKDFTSYIKKKKDFTPREAYNLGRLAEVTENLKKKQKKVK